jgi:hypothetical protein
VGDEVGGSPLAGRLLSSVLSAHNTTAATALSPPPGSLLGVAVSRGYSALGEMFNASQLGAVAAALGYRAAVHANGSLATLRALLAAGRPVLVPFDAEGSGEPGEAWGERAHYAVVVGLATSTEGAPLVLARHPWNLRALHAWPWEALHRSTKQLYGTSFYGGAGRSHIPASVFTGGKGGIPTPKRMRLGAAKGHPEVTDTSTSLAGCFVEVVPGGLELLGATEVWDEGEVL